MSAIANNPWLWECLDCGAVVDGHAAASLIPVALDEQRAHPLCIKCWTWRFEQGLMALSGQANSEPPESEEYAG